MIPTLQHLPHSFKQLLMMMTLTLLLGVTMGLGLVMTTTGGDPSGIRDHYQGDVFVEGQIPEHYPMPVQELLITTHNHILTFTFIFGFLAGVIQFSGRLTPRQKRFLSIEPFISIVVTFGSMWGIRFISNGFVFLMIISSVLMYLSFYTMATVIFVECRGKN